MRSTYSSTDDKDLKVKLTWPSVRRLLSLAIPYRGWLIAAGLLMLVGTGISLALPLLIKTAVAQVQTSGRVQDLDRSALLLLLLVLFGAAVNYVQFLLAAYAGNRIVTDLRLRLFAHLQRLPVAFFDRSRSGDLTSHLSNDVGQLQATLTDDLVKIVGNLVQLFGGIIVAVALNWQLTLVVVTLLVFVMAYFVVFGRALRLLTRKGLDALSEAIGSMTEALANIRLVKAFHREPHEDRRAEEKLGEFLRLSLKGVRWEAMMVTVATGGFTAMLLAVMWYSGRGLLSGSLQLGNVAGFFVAMFMISGPMAQIASLYTRLQRAVGAAERLFGFLDTPAEEPDRPESTAFPKGAGAVRFEAVQFSYVAEVPVLQDLHLSLPAGKVTALVGPSGAGKSTVASLLFRFYEPSGGRITIDEVDLRDIQRGSLRDHMAIVPQDPILFSGSLRENIRYGRLNATDGEIEEAARQANVAEFVSQLPDGYETKIGERGVTLSGGQRQRVAIARAILKNPRILVLDEATSALDNRSEALVKEALDRLMQGRTTLIIAHRLTTIQNADQIAVISGGAVVETGTHESLLRSGGTYAELALAAV